MNKITQSITVALSLLGAAQLPATVYSDATGDTFTGAGGGILDIASVEVSQTATDLIFKINVTGDPVAADWGKYLIALDTTAGGDTTGNGWGRPISMPAGMDYWVGSWVDSGNGAELYKYTGSWNAQSTTYGANPDNLGLSKNTSSITLQFAYAGLGLGAGSTLYFDVFTSGGGGGDGAIDALSDPAQSVGNWGDAYASQSTLSYTIQPIPEPTTLALLGLSAAGLVIFRRKF